MHFAEPQRLLWLLLAIPVVLAYLLTLVRRRQQVATVALWAKALARREPWTVWRRWASLLAAVLLLVALVVTAAEPRFSAGGGRALVLVIDVSASMKASDVAPSRFAAARAEAQRILDSLGSGDRAAILSAGSLTRVHCGLTSDHVLLDRALAGVRATDGTTNLREAVDVARGLTADTADAQILVLTDAGFDDAELVAAKDVRWLLHRGKAGDAANVAITRFEVRPNALDGSQARALIETTNFGDKPATAKLHVYVGTNEQFFESLELPPGTPVHREIALKTAGGVLISAALEADDALAADNLALTAAEPRQVVEVALVGEPSILLRDAIVANPGLQIVDETALGDQQQQSLRLKNRATPQVISVVNRPTTDTSLRGPALVIAPTADAGGLWRFQGTRDEDAFIGGEALTEARLDISGLQNVAFGRTVRLEFQPPSTTLLASTSNEPIVSLLPRESGDLIVVHAPVEGGDLARHPEFPLLLDELIRRIAGGTQFDTSSLDTASTIEFPEPWPPQKLARFLTSPDGRRRLVIGREPYVTLDEAGLWRTTSIHGPSLPVSLLDPRESDLRTVADVKSQPWSEPAQTRVPLWIFFALAALLLVAFEWTLQRRGTLE